MSMSLRNKNTVTILENIHYEKHSNDNFPLVKQLNELLEQTITKNIDIQRNIDLYKDICEAIILALDEEETNNKLSSSNYKILNKSMKLLMSIIPHVISNHSIFIHHTKYQALLYCLLAAFHRLLSCENNKLLIDFGKFVIQYSVEILNMFTKMMNNNHDNREDMKNNGILPTMVASVFKASIENIELFANETNTRVHRFNFVECNAIKTLCRTIMSILNVDKKISKSFSSHNSINNNDANINIIVASVDIIANLLTDNDISNHMTTMQHTHVLLSVVDQIYVTYLCPGNDDIQSNDHNEYYNSANIINKMKKKYMMVNNLLKDEEQCGLSNNNNHRNHGTDKTVSYEGRNNINNISFNFDTGSANGDQQIITLFDSITNLTRNVVGCNVLKKINVIQSTKFIKALLHLEYIHDHNIVSIFHNLTARDPPLCTYILQNTTLINLFAKSFEILMNDEAFYNADELLCMQYYTICTLQNILLSRLNNINLASSNLVIDSNERTPTLNNAINMLRNVTNAEHDSKSITSNGVKVDGEGAKTVDHVTNVVDRRSDDSSNSSIESRSVKNQKEIPSNELKKMWTLISYGMQTINHPSLAYNSTIETRQLIIDILEVSTGAIRILYKEIQIGKNKFNILNFERDILDNCELALAIMKYIFPILLLKMGSSLKPYSGNIKEEEEEKIKTLSDTFSNCVFILQFIFDIELENDIENDSLNMCRKNVDTNVVAHSDSANIFTTQIQLFKQKINQFISADVIPTPAIRNKLTNSKWVHEGIVQELQSLVDKTEIDNASILSSKNVRGNCAIM
jgi:hypothetical protein